VADPLAPVTLESEEAEAPAAEPDPPPSADATIDLRAHRAELLAAQGITSAELARRTGRGAVIRDLIIALAYSAYALPLGLFVLAEGRHQGHFGLSAILAVFGGLFFVLMWRSFLASLRAMRRSRSYEGVLRDVDVGSLNIAEFDGGTVRVPDTVHGRLQRGVRYRIHAPDTEEVAVDVAIDDVDVAEQSAYR
jgi:hypothetical protein